MDSDCVKYFVKYCENMNSSAISTPNTITLTNALSPHGSSSATNATITSNVNLVDLGKKLLEASRNGETEEVKALMQSGAPFTTDWLGTSPLHFAAQLGHTDTAEVLLRAGISRDARTKVDRTPLHIAAQEGHLSIVSLLITHGCDIDARDMLKMTPLHWAVERGHMDVIDCLLNNGTDVNIVSKFEKTSIDIAADNGYQDLVAKLQQYVGKARAKPEPKPTPSHTVKMRPTVLPNKAIRTPKVIKNHQTNIHSNIPIYHIPLNFTNCNKKTITIENTLKMDDKKTDITRDKEVVNLIDVMDAIKTIRKYFNQIDGEIDESLGMIDKIEDKIFNRRPHLNQNK